jgi:hypothetical protein
MCIYTFIIFEYGEVYKKAGNAAIKETLNCVRVTIFDVKAHQH